MALITGGDSGIGRAVALAFASEGADVAIVYRNEHRDAKETARLVKETGRSVALIPGDIGRETFCNLAVRKTLREFNKLDILVNNAAEQHPTDSIFNISRKQLEKTFQTNLFAHFLPGEAVSPGFSSLTYFASCFAYRLPAVEVLSSSLWIALAASRCFVAVALHFSSFFWLSSET